MNLSLRKEFQAELTAQLAKSQTAIEEKLGTYTRLHRANLMNLNAENVKLLEEIDGLKLAIIGPKEHVWKFDLKRVAEDQAAGVGRRFETWVESDRHINF